MIKTIHAIYEHGALRPLEPIEGIEENAEVEIAIITKEPKPHPLAEICGIMPKEDAEEMLKIIEEEFEKVNPDEW